MFDHRQPAAPSGGLSIPIFFCLALCVIAGCDGSNGDPPVSAEPTAPARTAAPAVPGKPAVKFERGKLKPGAPRRVVFVSIDTLAANHLSTYGYGRLTSPALSELAEESVVFDNAIAPAPWTYPSYAAQLTSRHSTAVMKRGFRVPDSEHLLAEYMRAAGYETAGFVDNEYLAPQHGMHQGFEHYRATHNVQGRSLREALRWVESHQERPFFLFAHTNDVHGPYRPQKPWVELFQHDRFFGPERELTVYDSPQTHVFGALPRYQVIDDNHNPAFYEARYDACIRQTDFWLERLLMRLRAMPGWDETLVVFSADHGESFGNHDFYLNHGIAYEDIIRVPLLVRLPGGERAGTRIEPQVSLIDLLPTFLELTGQKAHGEIAGRSLLPLMRGERQAQSKYVFASAGIFPQFMVRTDRYKLLRFQPGHADQELAYETFPREPKPGKDELVWELYDLQNDPDEKHNLAKQLPKKVKELREVLERWMEDRPVYEGEAYELDEAEKSRLRELGYVE